MCLVKQVFEGERFKTKDFLRQHMRVLYLLHGCVAMAPTSLYINTVVPAPSRPVVKSVQQILFLFLTQNIC